MKSAFVRHFFIKCRGKGCNKIYFDKHYIKSESVKIKVYFFQLWATSLYLGWKRYQKRFLHCRHFSSRCAFLFSFKKSLLVLHSFL